MSINKDHYDFLIIGAGFSGIVLAERISTELGLRCLVVDKRNHIGGNSYDTYDKFGVLIHPYGPHYFRSNQQHVIEYLSKFTTWLPTRYKVLSYTDGIFYSFPINLKTFRQFKKTPQASEKDFLNYLKKQIIHTSRPTNSEEKMLSQIGPELYEKFFKGYTWKQWKKSPKELAPSICGRIPVRTNENDDYLDEKFQALPKYGYSAMFQNMIQSTENLKVELGVRYDEIKDKVKYDFLIFTGAIDQYFRYCYGVLPYRSLRFELENFEEGELRKRENISQKKGYWQPEMQVNYPNEEEFNRIVEIKHATQQHIASSTIIREYSMDYDFTKEPYYPIPTEESEHLYSKYFSLAKKEKNTYFVGRLAMYRYYNMDQCVAIALKTFEKIRSLHNSTNGSATRGRKSS